MEEKETMPEQPITSIAKIAKALAKAQSEFKEVKKDATAKIPMKKGGHYTYKYATLPNIIESSRDALSKNGIAITQPIVFTSKGQCLQTLLIHESGETLKSEMPLNTNQAPQLLGSLLTYYRRYQLSAILGIAADEDEDGQAAQDGYSKQKQQAPQKPKAQVNTYKNGITSNHLKALFALAGQRKWGENELRELLSLTYKLESTRDLNLKEFNDIMNTIKAFSYDEAMARIGVDESQINNSNDPEIPQREREDDVIPF